MFRSLGYTLTPLPPLPTPPPPPDTAIVKPTTGREECHLLLLVFNKQCVHLPSFLTLEKEFQTYLLDVTLQKYRNHFIILSYHTIQHVCKTTYSANNQSCNTRCRTIFDPSMIFIANNCTYIAQYLEILIESETKYIMKYS